MAQAEEELSLYVSRPLHSVQNGPPRHPEAAFLGRLPIIGTVAAPAGHRGNSKDCRGFNCGGVALLKIGCHRLNQLRSVASTSRDPSTSIQSVVFVLHGRSRIVSSQVRMLSDSGLWSLVR
jgi:hypothetical protein